MHAWTVEALTARPARREPGFSYFTAPAAPFELDFGAWLAERTPPGAATAAVRPPGGRTPADLPRIREAVPSPNSLLRRRRASAPAVHAAYLADIAGLSSREIVKAGRLGLTTERAVRQHIRDGRLTAADLGMWPWAVVNGKPLPRNWWADRDFALALRDWAVRKLTPPDVEPAVRRVSSRVPHARLPIA
jgi:hypothetical protein